MDRADRFRNSGFECRKPILTTNVMAAILEERPLELWHSK